MDGPEEAPRRMLGDLPAARMVEQRPARARPRVVELPDQRAHAVRLERAPPLDRRAKRLGLLHLAEPDEAPEVVREAVGAHHRRRDALVAARVLLVRVHHAGGDIALGGVREARDLGQGREGLEAELRAKARPHLAVAREGRVLVPDRPVMHVARAVLVPGVAEVERPLGGGGRPPVRPRQCAVERGLNGAVQTVVGDEVAVAVAHRFLEPAERADQLVVAAPQRHAVRQAAGLVRDLGVDLAEEGGRRGVEIARQHRVLPDEQAERVAGGVELVRLVAPAAPDPDHGHARRGGRGEEVARPGRVVVARQRVGRHPARAPAEHVATVDAQEERTAGPVGLGDERHLAQGEAGATPDRPRPAPDRELERMERLGPVAERPPEGGVLHAQRERVAAVDQRPRRPGDGLAIGREERGDDLLGLRSRREPPRDLALDAHGDPARLVVLRDRGRRDLARRPEDRDPAIDAHRREGGGPVPAEVALRLAQHVAVGDRAVPGQVRHGVGLGGLQPRALGDGGEEVDRDLVGPLAEQAREARAPRAERVARREHRRAVHAHLGVAVHAVEHQRRGVRHGVQLEGARERPAALGHPARRPLVEADIGIGDHARIAQRAVHVARQVEDEVVLPALVGQAPGAAKVDRGGRPDRATGRHGVPRRVRMPGCVPGRARVRSRSHRRPPGARGRAWQRPAMPIDAPPRPGAASRSAG